MHYFLLATPMLTLLVVCLEIVVNARWKFFAASVQSDTHAVIQPGSAVAMVIELLANIALWVPLDTSRPSPLKRPWLPLGRFNSKGRSLPIQHKDVSFWLPEPSKATPTSTHHANISITGTNRDFFVWFTAQRISAGTARPNPDTTAQAVPLPPEGQNPRPAAHFVPMIQIHAG